MADLREKVAKAIYECVTGAGPDAVLEAIGYKLGMVVLVLERGDMEELEGNPCLSNSDICHEQILAAIRAALEAQDNG